MVLETDEIVAKINTVFQIDGRDDVGVGKRHVERVFIRAQQHRRGMRTGSNGFGGLPQINPAGDLAGFEIQFSHSRPIP